MIVLLPPFCFPDNPSDFFGHALPRRTLEVFVLFIRLHPLFDVFNLLFGKSWNLGRRGCERNNSDLGNLRVQVRYIRRGYPGPRDRIGGREEGGYG